MSKLIAVLQINPELATGLESFILDGKFQILEQIKAALSVPPALFQPGLTEQAVGRSHRVGLPRPVLQTLSPQDVDTRVQETLKVKESLVDRAAELQPVPPAKGKLLRTPAAYSYLKNNKAAFNLVYDEAFSQIERRGTTDCWLLRSHVNVHRNERGTLVKRLQIHHLAKPLSAVPLVFFLLNGEIQEENIYNTCGVDRCVNPNHHRVGKPVGNVRARKAERERQKLWMTDVTLRIGDVLEGMHEVLDYMKEEVNPNRGLVIGELQDEFVRKRGWTLDKFTEAMKQAQSRQEIYKRVNDNHLFLKGYPEKAVARAF